MVFNGPSSDKLSLKGEIVKSKAPKFTPKPQEPLYSASAVADEHFADYLKDKSNSTLLEQKMLKVI